MKDISKEEFKNYINNVDRVSLVQFYLPWNNDCKKVTEQLIKIEKNLRDIDFYKIDINESGSIAATYYISIMPVILIFTKEGKLAKRLSGLNSDEFIYKCINDSLNNQLDKLY